MWPKAIAQLVELAPHITRLLPMADRLLKDKAAGDEATRRALDAHRQTIDTLSSSLRSDVGQITTQNLGVQKQLIDLDKHVSTVRSDAQAAKLAADTLQERVARVEAQNARLTALVAASLVLLVIALVLLVILNVHAH